MGRAVGTIHPGYHYHFIQIGGIRHGVLLILYGFIDLRLQLGCILG